MATIGIKALQNGTVQKARSDNFVNATHYYLAGATYLNDCLTCELAATVTFSAQAQLPEFFCVLNEKQNVVYQSDSWESLHISDRKTLQLLVQSSLAEREQQLDTPVFMTHSEIGADEGQVAQSVGLVPYRLVTTQHRSGLRIVCLCDEYDKSIDASKVEIVQQDSPQMP